MMSTFVCSKEKNLKYLDKNLRTFGMNQFLRTRICSYRAADRRIESSAIELLGISCAGAPSKTSGNKWRISFFKLASI